MPSSAQCEKIKQTTQTPLPEYEILACLPCGLVVLNAQGQIVWLNAAAQALIGSERVGKFWFDVIQQVFAPRADDGHEVSLVDGRRIKVAISSLNTLPGELVTLTDLTSTREYEEARENQRALIAIGRMTAQLAHQIRTPLSSAILFAEHLAQLEYPDKRYLKWIMRLQDCHNSIEQQIQDLLLFARGEAIKPVSTNMQVWGKQLTDRAIPLVESVSAQLLIDNQLTVHEMYIHSESLIGALLNLINNALQADATCITLSMQQPSDRGLLIKVTDNGAGMSDEVKAQAFAPFFTTRAQGTGLGLAVVFAVVKTHGGHVILESTLGQGSCITINLPG